MISICFSAIAAKGKNKISLYKYTTINIHWQSRVKSMLRAIKLSGFVAHNVSCFNESQGGGFHETDRSVTGDSEDEI